MEFKGTKGKWKYRDGYRNDIVTDDDRCFGICDLGTEQEAYLADYPIEELLANAKLIAASPKMYELLNVLHGRIDFSYESWGSDEGIKLSNEIEKVIKSIND